MFVDEILFISYITNTYRFLYFRRSPTSFFEHDMSDPPNIRTAFVAGTTFFSSTAFIAAGSYAIFHGHHQQFRYAFFTALNVGVAGGLFTGHPKTVLTLIYRDTSMFTTSPRSFADSKT